ncbi:MAG: glycerol-3-phosphate dehydrogenase [Alphaproteobacteria bacterium]|nr:glycerol-3-phosphate dehydrogenase [Alphaproteobacteria bacterium]OJV48042.1 MAG: glycerol-3-phosphate dehydrogenase [Alphaproteobacteria bacterium 43-37]
MREGSLEAPIRHPLDWQNEDFYNEEKLDAELRRQFDVCHGCRRCFNLCDSFPKLFDLIDQSPSGELDQVNSDGFLAVADACTLCDMCFMTKCPYVPPHEFNIDFPHLMLRYKAIQHHKGETSFVASQLTETDRNGKLAAMMSKVVNWATDTSNQFTRPVIEKVMHIDRRAAIPKFHSKTCVKLVGEQPVEVNRQAPAYGRKAAVYVTCFANYNNPDIGLAARNVLAKNGVETQFVYPECCGMPQLENGKLDRVAQKAESVSKALQPWIEQGYDIIALIPSCALMLKFEWPLLQPNNSAVKALGQATFDLSEYLVDIAKKEGLAQGLQPISGGVTVHIACHARAQNMGQKAADLLRLVPETTVEVVERCSGHGGSWGMMLENFEVAMKVGRPAARQIKDKATQYVASECPLAGAHLAQELEAMEVEINVSHPIELFAKAYGF